jgi:nucleoid-associated protein YgaU
MNEEEIYEELFEERGIKKLEQYTTPDVPELTDERRFTLQEGEHIWKTGDRLWKIAAKYYGDSTLWWLIAWYNEKPTDAHYDLGDIVYVPLPLGRIMSYWNIAP